MSAAAHEVFDRTPYQAPAADLVESSELTEDRLFSAEGRIGVLRYNRRIAECMLAMVAAGLALFAAVSTDIKALQLVVAIPAAVVFICGVVIMLYAAVKRLHDLGRSGWFYLLGIIPLVGAIWVLYYSLVPGKDDGNLYGARREATKTDKVLGIIGIAIVTLINVATLATVFTQ